MPLIEGGAGTDNLMGTTGDDVINGHGANDQIYLSDGTDALDGGDGDDDIVNALVGVFGLSAPTGPHTYVITASGVTGGTINTTFSNVERLSFFDFASSYNDTIDASAWAPSADWTPTSTAGGAPSLTIGGGAGDDTIIGSVYGDIIHASLGANVVDAGAGIDFVSIAGSAIAAASIVITMDGDTLVATQAGAIVNRVSNAETVQIAPSTLMGLTIDASSVSAGAPLLVLTDSLGNDVFTGSAHADTFFTASTTAFLGQDTYTGNGGADIYSFADGGVKGLDGTTVTDFDADDRIDLNGNDGTETPPPIASFKPLVDTFIGTAAFSGNDGEYRYYVSDGRTFVQVDSNGDGVADGTLTLASGAFALEAFDDAELGLQTLRIAQAVIAASGTTGADTLAGGLAGDTLRGRAGNDTLVGNWGDDALTGDAGNDTLDGGDGNDSLTGGDGDDWLRGGAGIDTASYAGATASVTVNLGRTTAQNTGAGSDRLESIENATGSVHDDVLRGNDASNDLRGGDGADRLEGGLGDDSLNGGNGNDVLIGQAGIDAMRGGLGDDLYYVDAAGDAVIEAVDAGVDAVRASVDYVLAAGVETLSLLGAARAGTGNALANSLFGSGGGDTLAGLAGDDILRGNDGRDGLNGGDGADLLDGGAGKDTLTGGAGRDVFQFRDGDFGATRSLADVITDFSHVDAEKMQLNLVDADAAAAGNQAFAWLGTEAFTGIAGQLHYVQAAGNTYVEGDTDGDGVADFIIALTGAHSLVAGDFVL